MTTEIDFEKLDISMYIEGSTFGINSSSRKILLNGDIVPLRLSLFINLAIGWFSNSSNEPITFYINSNGAMDERLENDDPANSFVDGLLNIYQSIKASPSPFHGVVIGAAHSSALFILQGCQRRLAFPEATLMYGAPTITEVRTDLADDKRLLADIRKMRHFNQGAIREIADRSGHPIELVTKWASEQKVFTAEEAKDFNLIDEISNPAE